MSTGALSERTIVVTGAAGGIGQACRTVLEAAGATVVGVDRRVVPGAPCLHYDLSDIGQLGECIAAIGSGPIHGLVNNAAASTIVPTPDVRPALWDEMFAINTRAPFFLSEALLPAFTEDASVVNVSSVHAVATSGGAVPYAASKGALLALTRALAVDWSTRGISVRVNAVAPGAVDTPMLQDGLERTGVSLRELESRHPLGRVGTAEEVAAVIAFLLAPNSGFVHGATIIVDGGVTARLSTENAPG